MEGDGHTGRVKGADQRDYQGVGVPPNAVPGLDEGDKHEGDSDGEIRNQEDEAEREIPLRREPQESFILFSVAGGVMDRQRRSSGVERAGGGFRPKQRNQLPRS